jgi:hypothetical protein
VVIAEDGSRQIVDSDHLESATNDSFSFGRSMAANSAGEAHRASAFVERSTSSTATQASSVNAGPASCSDERSAAAGTMEARMARLERSVTHQLEEMAELMRAIAVRPPAQQSGEPKRGGPARAAQQSDHDKYAA